MAEKTLSSKIKEVFTHAIIYGFGSALQSLLGFILIPFYTKYYTTEIYGVFSLITLCGTLAGAFFYLGASSALSRSYFDYNDPLDRKKVVTTALYITLLGVFLQIGIGYFLSPKLSLTLFQSEVYKNSLILTFVSTSIGFLNTLFYVLLRFEKKSKQVVLSNLISFIITTLLILYFLIQLNLGVMAPILGGLLGQALLFFILFYLSKNFMGIHYSRHEFKVQLHFGIPTVFVGLSYYILDWVDRLFINKYCSLSDVGIYSFGYKIGLIIQVLFIIPFSQIWAPMRMEYCHDKNSAELSKLVLTYYFIIGLFMAVGVSVFAKDFILLIAKRPEYLVAYKVVPFIVLGHLMYGAINIVDSGIYLERKVSYYIYIMWFCLIINTGLNYLFIPKFGYMAAAYITLISYSSVAFTVFYVSNKLHTFPVEVGRLLKIFASGLTVLVLSIWAPQGEKLEVVGNTVFMVGFFVFLYLFVLNGKEKYKIRGLFIRRSISV